MRTTISLFVILIFSISLAGCSKTQENVEKKKDEKINEQLPKTDGNTQNTKPADTSKTSAGNKNEKKAVIKEITDESSILKDPKGQWPYDAITSSFRGNPDDDYNGSWMPLNLQEKPNVEKYGESGKAWSPKEMDKGEEWINVSFTKPVYATEVRVRQTFNPGAIIKVELIDDMGTSHTIWEGKDETKYKPNKIQYFAVSFDKTQFKVKSVKITLATNTVPGWNEIDAVQLVGE